MNNNDVYLLKKKQVRGEQNVKIACGHQKYPAICYPIFMLKIDITFVFKRKIFYSYILSNQFMPCFSFRGYIGEHLRTMRI